MSVRARTPLSRPVLRHALLSTGAILAIGTVVGAATLTNANAAVLPTVTLTVDGSSAKVATTATTVNQVLGDHSVTTDSNDSVTPGPWTQVSNGMTINVVTRVQVKVKRPAGVTNRIVDAGTVAQLEQTLALPTRKATTAGVTSRTTADVVTFKRTIVETPRGRRLTVGDPLVEGTIATVERVRVVTDGRRQAVRHDTVTKRTPLLRSGTTQLLKRGHDGRRHVTMRTTRVNGVVVRRAILDKTTLRRAQNRVIAVGTGPNWTGLARCESGNNPNAVNPSGFYGLYQFNLSTWQSVGGSGNPVDASRWEQTKRAWVLYRSSGSSPWPVCGAYL
ncbi:MAG: transglycosylase family protein [Actinomycetes bacterium]